MATFAGPDGRPVWRETSSEDAHTVRLGSSGSGEKALFALRGLIQLVKAPAKTGEALSSAKRNALSGLDGSVKRIKLEHGQNDKASHVASTSAMPMVNGDSSPVAEDRKPEQAAFSIPVIKDSMLLQLETPKDAAADSLCSELSVALHWPQGYSKSFPVELEPPPAGGIRIFTDVPEQGRTLLTELRLRQGPKMGKARIPSWQLAAVILQAKGAVTVDATAQFVPSRADADKSRLPALKLDMTVSLLPSFFHPKDELSLERKALQAALFTEADLQLANLKDVRMRQQVAYTGEEDTEFLYNCLPPAPIDVIATYSRAPSSLRKGKERGDADSALDVLAPVELICKLLPFQSRSVRWLLHREGKQIVGKDSSSMADVPDHVQTELRRALTWTKIGRIDLPDKPPLDVWLDQLTGQFSSVDPAKPEDRSVRGRTVLADYMGCGKTVEILALILLNQDRSRSHLPSYRNDDLDTDIVPIRTTLIICPATILQQWADEIEKHAPSVRVLIYKDDCLGKHTPQSVDKNFDIVICSFTTLKSMIHYARKPRRMPTRRCADEKTGEATRKTYDRPLFVEAEFFRVIMDEVQLNGTATASAEMCSYIHRVHAHAVSGTPVGESLRDLRSVYAFLKLPWLSQEAPFEDLLRPRNASLLARITNKLGVRVTRADVAAEFALPAQLRQIVPVTLSMVEQYHRDATYAQACNELGLDRAEGPQPGWRPSLALMGKWLDTLRRLNCHPEMGDDNRRAVNRGANVTELKTLSQVLEAFEAQAAQGRYTDTIRLHKQRFIRARLISYDNEDCECLEKALALYHSTIDDVVAEKALVEADLVKVESELKEVESRRGSTVERSPGPEAPGATTQERRQAKRETDLERSLRRRKTDLSGHRSRVFALLHPLHHATASIYFMLGKPELETEHYDKAAEFEREILEPHLTAVDVAISQLVSISKSADLSIDDFEVLPTGEKPGLLTSEHWDLAETAIDAANGLAELIWDWRCQIIKMVSQSVELADQEDIETAYATTENNQHLILVWLDILSMTMFDWRNTLEVPSKGEASAAINVSVVGQVKTDAATKHIENELFAADRRAQAARKEDAGSIMQTPIVRKPFVAKSDNIGEKLLEKLSHQSCEAMPASVVSLRVIIKDLKRLLDSDPPAAEKKIIATEHKRLRAEVTKKNKLYDKLREEYRAINNVMRARQLYYKALVDLSDETAILPDEQRSPGFISANVALSDKLIVDLTQSIAVHQARVRYIHAIGAGEEDDEPDQSCQICMDVPQGRAVLTSCGHVYCATCWKLWAQHSSIVTCPCCRKTLGAGATTQFSTSPKKTKPKTQLDAAIDAMKAQPLHAASVADIDQTVQELNRSSSLTEFGLNVLSTEEYAELTEMQINGETLSSKLDLVVKIASWHADRHEKVVIFSAWKVAIDVLATALRANRIGSMRLDGRSNKDKINAAAAFGTDPHVTCFLLHAKSAAAGLTLTAASAVLLVEPLTSPAIELQAVSRVHRMGQEKETRCYQLFCKDTVDERIAAVVAQKGRSLFYVDAPITAAAEAANLTDDVDEDELARMLFDKREIAGLQKALLSDVMHQSQEESMDLDDISQVMLRTPTQDA
ncbi:hypothetical protein E5Q_03932 [Mixia osmundae IAM 14324]|uniref:RING-type domain-containing protein n=1 Tax=Mixia osmundae (strain CBS 9802 / IAM 14324 / JCM 22182 / KY 12970) TaxID=764103 RepID=G7E374_MIXOS|nr:hypothetical protein E5Q_03932 [Mixia osmundae IAM 14324]